MTIIDKLLIVQEHDLTIRGLEKELQDIPVKKKEEKLRLDGRRQALTEAEEQLKQTQAEIKKLELDSEAGHEKVTKLRQQQFEIKTNKEFKAMEVEIKGIEEEVSSLEDQQLELMGQVDLAKTDIGVKKNALAKEEADVQNHIKVLGERAVEVEAKLNEIRSVREAAAVEVDSNWIKRYETILGRRDKALVAIEGDVCGGCHMKLPRYVIHDAKKQADMVMCGFCGRLLY